MEAMINDDYAGMSIVSAATLDGVTTGAVRRMLDVMEDFVEVAAHPLAFLGDIGYHTLNKKPVYVVDATCPGCNVSFKSMVGLVGAPRRFCSSSCYYYYSHGMRNPHELIALLKSQQDDDKGTGCDCDCEE